MIFRMIPYKGTTAMWLEYQQKTSASAIDDHRTMLVGRLDTLHTMAMFCFAMGSASALSLIDNVLIKYPLIALAPASLIVFGFILLKSRKMQIKELNEEIENYERKLIGKAVLANMNN